MKSGLIIAFCIVGLFGLLLVCGTRLAGCDIVAQTEESVGKYDELSAFFETGCVFVESGLDVDVGVMVCTFRLGESKEALLAALEKDGWDTTSRDENRVVLTRDTTPWTNDKTKIRKNTLEINFNSGNSLEFTWR